MAAVAAGLGRAVAPFTTQDDADEFERRIHSFAQGPPEARAYLAATCRRRSTQPETAKLLLLWLRDLDPKPETAA